MSDSAAPGRRFSNEFMTGLWRDRKEEMKNPIEILIHIFFILRKIEAFKCIDRSFILNNMC